MCKKIDAKPVKFVRGQIWFVNEDSDITELLRNEKSTVINGSRPYVVINVNDVLNTVTCCPLTSNTTTSYKSPFDIVFSNRGISDYSESRICVSQITTKSFVDFGNYMYSLDVNTIDILMASIQECLGIEKFRVEHKEETEHSIENDVEQKPFVKGIYSSKDWPLKTKEDAKRFMDEFGEMNCKKAADLFGVTTSTFYTWRWRASKLLYTK